jgi:hypothetical protein
MLSNFTGIEKLWFSQTLIALLISFHLFLHFYSYLLKKLR